MPNTQIVSGDLEHDLEFKGGLLMKNAVKDFARTLQQAEPDAEVSFEFWDGERLNIGNQPAVILGLKSEENAARFDQKEPSFSKILDYCPAT
jgi:hypothetical protein